MKQQRQQQQTSRLLAILAAWSLFLCSKNDNDYDTTKITTINGIFNNRETEDISRSLRYSQFIQPNSSIVSLHASINNDSTNSISNITIYLTKRNDYNNPALSIFKTDIFQRYGSGRFNFKIVPYAPCDYSCKNPVVIQSSHNNGGPCLAVGKEETHTCPHAKLECTYPQCKTMLTNDEKCQYGTLADVRQYYSSDFSEGRGFLPLGMRFDTWTALQSIIAMQQSSDNDSNYHHSIVNNKPASDRKFAFNAIFSVSTNRGRGTLRFLIDRIQPTSKLTIYKRIAHKWTPDVNSVHTAQANTDEYMRVLLDSVFTLAPAGRNPECFRLYEAVEAGSIPIMVSGDLYGGGGYGSWSRKGTEMTSSASLRSVKLTTCKESLRGWYDAPIVVLSSWNDLYPTVTKLMEDVEKLNEMQMKLRLWYDGYMARAIREFEDYMMDDDLYRME